MNDTLSYSFIVCLSVHPSVRLSVSLRTDSFSRMRQRESGKKEDRRERRGERLRCPNLHHISPLVILLAASSSCLSVCACMLFCLPALSLFRPPAIRPSLSLTGILVSASSRVLIVSLMFRSSDWSSTVP